MAILLEEHHLKQPDPEQRGSGKNASPGAASQPWDAVTLGLLAAALGLLLALSWPLPQHLWIEYTEFESYYAYGPAIPFIAGFLLWHRRKALRAVPRVPCLAALAVLLPATGLLIWSSAQEMALVMSFSFLLSFWAAVWLVLGTQWVRVAAFPLAFLVWMAPLPGPLMNDATYDSQHFCTEAASRLLGLLAFHPVIVGSVIQMDHFYLFVDVPCSGLKNLLSLMMISAAFAYLTDGLPSRRLGLFLFSIPLAVAVNIVRLTLLGICGECLGSQTAHVFHDWDGLLSLVLGVSALFWLARRIGCRTFAGWPLF